MSLFGSAAVVLALLGVALLAVVSLQAKAGGGELAFTPEKIDLGRVPLNQPVLFRSQIRNVGDGTVKISKPKVAALEGC